MSLDPGDRDDRRFWSVKIGGAAVGDHAVTWYQNRKRRNNRPDGLTYRFMLLGPLPDGGCRDIVACGHARGITTSKAGKWSAHLRVDAGDRLPAGMTGPILDALEAAL